MEKIAIQCPTILQGMTNIQTPRGVGKYEGIKITELGHVTIKVYFPEEEVYVNYTVGSAEELLLGANLQFCE